MDSLTEGLYLVKTVHELPLVEQYLAVRVVDDGLLDDGRRNDVVPNARPRTGLTPLSVSGSPLISVYLSVMYLLVTTSAHGNRLAFTGNHVSFPAFLSLQVL